MVSILLENRNLLFVHVPKTGGGSIGRVLREQLEGVIYAVQGMAIAEPCVQQLERRLPKPLSAYRTLAFVRNPWDWTVSGYLHVTQNAPAYVSPPPFRDFVCGAWQDATKLPYPSKFTNPLAYVAYHTQITQWEHLCGRQPAIRVDTICRFETLIEDFKEHFGARIKLPHANKSRRRPYADYYDAETTEIVARRNADLIDRFGYTFKGR